MNSKLLIDVDDQGTPILRVIVKPQSKFHQSQDRDVRDKLVERFLDGNGFAVISHSGDTGNGHEAEIYSMGPMDILENFINFFKPMMKSSDSEKEFEQAVFKVASILETECGMQSTAFIEKCKSQNHE